MLKREALSNHALNMALAATIKRARMKRGLNQQQLSLRTQLTPNFLSRIETGDKGCGIRTLRRLAFGLETTAWELLRSAEIQIGASAKAPPKRAAAAELVTS